MYWNGSKTTIHFIPEYYQYPEAYKYAAYDGLQRVAQREGATAAPGRARSCRS